MGEEGVVGAPDGGGPDLLAPGGKGILLESPKGMPLFKLLINSFLVI